LLERHYRSVLALEIPVCWLQGIIGAGSSLVTGSRFWNSTPLRGCLRGPTIFNFSVRRRNPHRQRLVDAIKQGVAVATLARDINECEAHVARLDAVLADLTDAPLHQRLAVMPVCVRQQLGDLSRVLPEDCQRLAKVEAALGL
jgi:hypothetical protein